jgi:hypothetical protein
LSRWNWLLPVSAIAAAAVTVAALVADFTGHPNRFEPGGRFLLVAVVVAVVWIVQFLGYLIRLARAGEASPLTAIKSDYRKAIPSLIAGTLGIVVMSVFLQAISELKTMITAVVPFWADAPLLAFDLALLGDIQPLARALNPAMPVIGWFYWSWHLINICGIVWVLHWHSPEGHRLVIAYMLTWAIGMAFAYLGSSAGPLFIGAYDPSLAPDTIQRASAALIENHISQGSMIGAGISAFPSLHVAIAVWFAFVLRERGLFGIGIAYAIGIYICSVLLGWHYSLDGVAGAGVAWLAYRIAYNLRSLPLRVGQECTSITA